MIGVVLLLSFIQSIGVLGNSAGVGIPCSSGFSKNYKLGHPTRGGLQEYQDRLDAASGNANLIAAIAEERVEHMKELEEEGYKMLWTLPPVASTRYTVRVGDGDRADDLTGYKPGQWMNVYVRALDEGAKFTGLIMYAVDGDEKEVGDWRVDPNSAFRFGRGPDGISCVTHRNAELKHYLNVFKFRAPPKGTGTIKFNVIVKVGLAFPVLDGTFFYPNAAPLTLREDGVVAQKWFEGEAGKSCDDVCGDFGMKCDLPTLTTIGNDKETFIEVATAFSPSCMGPIMPGCSASAPSVGSEGCFYHDSVCEDKPIVPPPVRKDPCEGLEMRTGNGNVEGGTCVKWSYQRQNNGVGRTVYNNLYSDGDIVKVCATVRTGWLQNQDSFNDNMKITGKCAPPGGFTPSPTNPPPPPRAKAEITCAASDEDIEDGGRICACLGTMRVPAGEAGDGFYGDGDDLGEEGGSGNMLVGMVFILLILIFVAVRFHWANKDGYDEMWMDCLPDAVSSNCPTCWHSLIACPRCKPCHDKLRVGGTDDKKFSVDSGSPSVPRWSTTKSIETAEKTRSRTLSLKKPTRPHAPPSAPPRPPSASRPAGGPPSPPALEHGPPPPPSDQIIRFVNI